MESPEPPKPEATTTTFWQILSKSKQIMKPNINVIKSLSYLLLILSAAIAAATLTILFFSRQNISTPIIVIAVLSVSSLILTPFAIGTFSFTALQSLSGNKTTLSAALNSLSSSFLPILATVFVSQSATVSLTIAYASLVAKASLYAIHTVVVFSVLFVVLLMFLQVNSLLAYPIAAFESSWGLGAFLRSFRLLRGGNEWPAVSLTLRIGFLYLTIFWAFGDSFRTLSELFGRVETGVVDWWLRVGVHVVVVFINVCFMVCVQSGYIVVSTIFYAFCSKLIDFNGEEFSDEYFRLPGDSDDNQEP